MTIYDPSGVVVYEAPITASSTIKRVLMGDYYIELVFDAVDRIDVGRGCYIIYDEQKFEIMSNVMPDDTNTGGYRYTLRFEAQQSQMKRCKVFWRGGDNLEVSFSNTTSLSFFGELIIENVNAFLGVDSWSLGDIPTDGTVKTVSFNGDSCWDAVANIAETFGVEWWTEYDGDNVRLCFGKLETGGAVEFRKGDIVSSIPSKKGDDAGYGTRFYVFGSTKNLPSDYGSTEEGGITNHVVEKRLHLPDGQQYIDAWENLSAEDIVEQVVIFEDIFPTNVETVTSVATISEEVIPGQSNIVYTVKCEDTPFDFDNIIEGEQIQANFTSGNLKGQTFDIEVDTTTTQFNKIFKIVPNVLDSDSGLIVPNESLAPSVGDTFILIGVELPNARIEAAKQELLTVGEEYAQKNSNDTEIYDCPTNAVYCHRNNCNYTLGQRVMLVGDKFGTSGRQSRIQGFEKKFYDEYQAIYTVGDNSPYSRLASLEKAIQKSSYGDRVGLEVNIIRSKSDTTLPSDYNVYSALAVEEYFLSKKRGGKVKGHTDFAKGISMYGIPWKYDVERDTWTIKGNVIITKGLATYSSLKEEDVLSVFDGLPIDNDTIQWKETESGKILVAVGGGSGGGIDEEQLQDYLDEKKYVTESWVTNKGYALQSSLTAVDNRLKSVETFFATDDDDTLINKWDEIVMFLNAVEGDTLDDILSTKFDKTSFTKSNIKSTLGISDWALASSLEWSAINSKPTTLSDYGIADAVKYNSEMRASAAYRELGYGYAHNDSEWHGSGPAIAFGNEAYKAFLQLDWNSGNDLWVGYDYNSGDVVWKRIAYDGESYTKSESNARYLQLTGGELVGDLAITAGTFYLNGAPMTYDSSKDAWTIKGNVIITKGLAVYSTLDEEDVLSVFDGLPIDNDTIQWKETESGKILVAVGGGTGGGIDEDTVNTIIDEALAGYATQSWVTRQGFLTSHQSLEGYAKESWVESKGYALGSTKITAGTGLTGGGTLSANRTLSLATVGTAGEYTKVTTDAYGRVKSGTTLSASDIPSLSWSKITSGKPTTLSGYGITDAIKFLDGIDASSAYKEVGYGYKADGWVGAGPAMTFGAKLSDGYFYKALLQYNWDDYGLHIGYVYRGGSTVWKKLAYAGTTLSDYGITDAVAYNVARDITARHNYTNGVKIGGALITYDSSKNALILPTNVVIEGGLATYTKLEGWEDLDITMAISVDGTSISNEGGILHFIGETGGVDEDAVNELISDALVGYAKESWVTNKGYITSSDIPTKVSAFTNDSGYITDITSSMVTTALGYTPLSTTGTAASSKLLVGDKVTSLKANTWNNGDGLSVGGWNKSGGFNTVYGTTLNITGFNSWRHRLAFNTSGDIEHWMAINTTTMSKVGDIAYVKNIPTKLSQLTDDVVNVTIEKNFVNGLKLFGKAPFSYDSSKNAWQLNGNLVVTGGMASYTALEGFEDLDVMGGIVTDGTTIHVNDAGRLEVIGLTNAKTISAVYDADDRHCDLTAGGMKIFSPTTGFAAFSHSVATNAGTSLGALSGAVVSGGTLQYIYYGGSWDYPKMTIYGNKVGIGIGNATPSQVLHVGGNGLFTGTVTENSDRKLKNVEYEGDGLALTDLKKIKVAKWHWKDKRDKRLHIGGVADNLAEIMPEVVFESEDENGVITSSIAYGKAGFAVAASLVAPVSRHEDRIKELEKNIEKMQKELQNLKKTA